MKRPLLLKISFVGILIASITCSLYFYGQSSNMKSDYDHIISEKTTEIKNLKEDMAGQDSKLSQQKELLDSRQGFLDSISKAKTALLEAGKVSDVTQSRTFIETAQEKAYQERENPNNITIQTAAVDKETGMLLGRTASAHSNLIKPNMIVTADDLFGDLPGLRTLPPSHPARQALDAVGGADIKIGTAPQVCGRNDSLACSYPSEVILIAGEFSNENYDFYYPVMMHEYAHQIQYKYDSKLSHSKKYTDLFGGDREWLADCMAASKIPGYMSNYRYQCSTDQKEYGAGAWKGIFP